MGRILFVTTDNQFGINATVRKNDYDEYEVRLYGTIQGRKVLVPDATSYQSDLEDGCLTALMEVHGRNAIPNHYYA